MVFHMLAVFDHETARAPPGIESWQAEQLPHSPVGDDNVAAQQREATRRSMERCFASSKPAHRHLELIGSGAGFTFEASPFCSTASKDDVHVLFAGEVAAWPGIDAVSVAHDAFIRNVAPPEASDAHWLLDFYKSFSHYGAEDMANKALECLSKIEGSFSFVIFDEAQHRVLAARDQAGTQPLYWGASDDGHLMFGSVLEDLVACNPTATMFPAGTLFASERHARAYSPGPQGWVISCTDLPGQMLSFIKAPGGRRPWRDVKAIPRLDERGTLCGAVYRVASLQNLQPAS